MPWLRRKLLLIAFHSTESYKVIAYWMALYSLHPPYPSTLISWNYIQTWLIIIYTLHIVVRSWRRLPPMIQHKAYDSHPEYVHFNWIFVLFTLTTVTAGVSTSTKVWKYKIKHLVWTMVCIKDINNVIYDALRGRHQPQRARRRRPGRAPPVGRRRRRA